MATSQKLLIEAIRRIAKTDPEISSLLKAVQNRGGLDGLRKRIGGSDEAAFDSCCTDGQDGSEQPDGDGDTTGGNDGSIDGDRPDDGDNEKGMDGNYRMPDGTFQPWDNQPCTPDPSWEEGKYWTAMVSQSAGLPETKTGNGTAAGAYGAAAAALSGLYPYTTIFGDTWNYSSFILVNSYRTITAQVTVNGEPASPRTYVNAVAKIDCGGSPESYCTITEAPCQEDQEWPSDGKCQEALIGGQFVPHPNDPDCAGQQPQPYQVMCDADKCVAYIPTKDGGHIRVDIDPVTRLPTSESTARTYNSDGQFQGETDYRYDNVKYNAYSNSSIPTNWGP